MRIVLAGLMLSALNKSVELGYRGYRANVKPDYDTSCGVASNMLITYFAAVWKSSIAYIDNIADFVTILVGISAQW